MIIKRSNIKQKIDVLAEKKESKNETTIHCFVCGKDFDSKKTPTSCGKNNCIFK